MDAWLDEVEWPKMLEFRKIKDDGNAATFEYYPEGKGEPGAVAIDRSVGAVSVLSVSPNDRHERYAEHMFAETRQMLRDGSVRDGGTVFWY